MGDSLGGVSLLRRATARRSNGALFKRVKAEVEIEYSSINAIYEDIPRIELCDEEYKKQIVVGEVVPGCRTEKAGVKAGFLLASINYTSNWGLMRPELLLTKFNPPYVIGFASQS